MPVVKNKMNGSPRKRRRRKLRAFDLFCGAGGSSYGALTAGVRIVGGVERAPLAAATYRDNFPGAKLYSKDIRKLSPRRVAREVGRVDILLASPECTNHTVAKGKKRVARSAQHSRMTAYEVIRFAKALKPRWIVVENVTQMKYWARYRLWRGELEGLGYKVSEQVLNSSCFGVRQTRRRLFVLCGLKRKPALVQPTTTQPRAVRPILNMNGAYPYSLLNTPKRAKSTLARFQRGLQVIGRRKPFLLVYYGSDGSGGFQRLNAPLRTITTVDRFALVKWEDNRYRMRMLQVPELKQAMGFPLSFKLKRGVRRDKIGLMGNGVCPPVMKAIIKRLVSKRGGSEQVANG
jgi:DNA (cytosine-5)-methyltransferase 1